MKQALVRFSDGRMVTGDILKEMVYEWTKRYGFLWVKSKTMKENQYLIGYWRSTMNDEGVQVTNNYYSEWYAEDAIVKIYETNE